MQGKQIIGKNNEQIGRVIGIDEEQTTAIVQTANGAMVSVMPEMLTDQGNQVAVSPAAAETVPATAEEAPAVIVVIDVN